MWFHHITFCKKQNYGKSKKDQWLLGIMGEGGKNRKDIDDF